MVRRIRANRSVGVKLHARPADRAIVTELPTHILIAMALIAGTAVLAILHVLSCIVRNETYVWTVRNRCDELRHKRQLDLLLQLQERGMLGDEAGEVDVIPDDAADETETPAQPEPEAVAA